MDSPTTSGKTERLLPRLPGDVLRIGARSVLPSSTSLTAYVFMLSVLKGLLCDIEYGIIMLDFERASMNAFTQVFDQFSLMNCFFHLCQSVQRRIQKSFKVKYRTDKSFALASRLDVFLAFVPLEHWNHNEMVLIDPDYPARAICFHLGFKGKVNRPKPSVQEY